MYRQRQSEKLITNFPGIFPHPRPDWFTGFVDGEGCFYVSITKNKKTKDGVNVALVFSISQHVRDELLLTKFIEGVVLSTNFLPYLIVYHLQLVNLNIYP